MIRLEEYDTSESLGYTMLKEDVIKCADCGRRLIDIIKVKEDDTVTKEIVVSCPFCDGSSFLYRIQGHSYLQAYKTVAIKNMPTEIIDNVTHINIEVIKK